MCSPDTFGNGGLWCALNFCNPQLDIVVNFLSNTLLKNESHIKRSRDINKAIYNAYRIK